MDGRSIGTKGAESFGRAARSLPANGATAEKELDGRRILLIMRNGSPTPRAIFTLGEHDTRIGAPKQRDSDTA